ncbi:uncharacterized protein LOC126382128 isoform X2 [Pectinophora gossypiella]|uniref:uncharacterized protein LOC126382128 isoform X2 n=1 Tax=Pectinophora gossypiella TaxID=13191 RepID=UPI00214F2761|nr:uncharacterized protein LOC126382128 isoform X2 [Pectinophora gossypiella]
MFRLLLYCLVFNLFGKSQSSNDNSTTPLHNVTTPPHTPPPHTPPHNSTLHHTPPDNTTPHRAEPHHTSTAAPTQPHPSPTHAVSSVPITFPTVTTSKATQPVSATIQSTIPPTTEQTTAVTAVPTDKPSDTQATNHLVIVSITGVVGALLLGLMAGFLIKRFRNAKTRTPHISEEPSMSAQDNVYSYVPLETVSFYQAKALAASNTPKSMESVGPPPLPERPRQERTINEEEEYIYSYAYGIKTPQSYNP